ncbi:MAG: tripartite tricarboxylate transporter substrate binding protein [Variovorax sp.]
MVQRRMIGLALLALAVCGGAAGTTASAQDFPNRPVTLIVTSSPGGALDSMTRIVADSLTKELGQPVVVENQPGAIGSIAANKVVRATPDGYTLLATSSSAIALAPHRMKSPPYDPFTDLAPVSEMGEVPFVLVARPGLHIKTLKDFIAAAKQKPDDMTYASAGLASPHHLAMEQLLNSADIRVRHIPYKTGPLGFTGLLGDQVDVMMIAPGTTIKQVQAGKLLALGVSAKEPLESYPGVPPIGTLVPGYESVTWFGVFAPVATSAAIIDKLSQAINAVIRTPTVQAKMKLLDVEPRPSTPAELKAVARADFEVQGKLLKKLGIEPQ